MAELAAHLMDGVIPDLPTCQWPAPKWAWSMPTALRLHMEHADIGVGTHDRFIELARRLVDRLGIATTSAAAATVCCAEHASCTG
jgi:hypothetical protein